MNQEYFKTKNGTELPILNLKGKPYLQVAHRIIWMREQNPLWSIETEQLLNEKDYAIFKCIIKNEEGRIIATAHAREDYKHFIDAIEKCETKSIGRALALCGYGTQFAEVDFDEMPRIVDSPIMPAKAPKPDYRSPVVPVSVTAAPAQRLQEAAIKNAWSGEQMRLVMLHKYAKTMIKQLTESDINELCELMTARTFSDVEKEMKGSVK